LRIKAGIKLVFHTYTVDNKWNIFRREVAKLSDIVFVASRDRIKRETTVLPAHARISLVVVVADLIERFRNRFTGITIKDKETQLDLTLSTVLFTVRLQCHRRFVFKLADRCLRFGPVDLHATGASGQRHSVPPESVGMGALKHEIIFRLENVNVAAAETIAERVAPQVGFSADNHGNS
jgi:hypothetical protein